MNSLSDFGMIDKLYEASNAGKNTIRGKGICSLIPGVKGMSANIKAISIVDNYLDTEFIFLEMPDKQRFYFFSRFYESRWTGRGDMPYL
jgi:polyphosphate kinase